MLIPGKTWSKPLYVPLTEALERVGKEYFNKAITGLCANCHSAVGGVIHRVGKEWKQALLYSTLGGAATSNCPQIVSHYLQQAWLAANARAYRAAVAMNRAAFNYKLRKVIVRF